MSKLFHKLVIFPFRPLFLKYYVNIMLPLKGCWSSWLWWTVVFLWVSCKIKSCKNIPVKLVLPHVAALDSWNGSSCCDVNHDILLQHISLRVTIFLEYSS